MSDTHSPEPAATEPPAPPVVAAPETSAPPAAPPAVPPKPGIAVAALVIGIVAAFFAIIPGPSFGAFVPAILAAVLGVVALTRKTPRRGFALSGIILGAVSLLVAIVVSIATIAGIAHVATAAPAAVDGGLGSASKPNVTPKPTPTVAPVPADASYSGSGDSIIPIALPDGADSPGVATITNSGGDNFVVWSLDSNVQQLGLLVNTIGGYSGTVLFDIQSNQHTAQLQITSSGSWTVTLHSIRALRQFTEAGATGSGDDVLIYEGKAGGAKIHNDGGDNFVVWEYGNTSNLAVNEIGPTTASCAGRPGRHSSQ